MSEDVGTKIGRKTGTRVKKFIKEHGKGPYGWAAGFTWLYSYSQMVYADWMESWKESSGIVDFMLTEFVFDFGIEALIHAFLAGLYAAFWPLFWLAELGGNSWLS